MALHRVCRASPRLAPRDSQALTSPSAVACDCTEYIPYWSPSRVLPEAVFGGFGLRRRGRRFFSPGASMAPSAACPGDDGVASSPSAGETPAAALAGDAPCPDTRGFRRDERRGASPSAPADGLATSSSALRWRVRCCCRICSRTCAIRSSRRVSFALLKVCHQSAKDSSTSPTAARSRRKSNPAR